ncbi:MAG TPA: ATP-binding protein [Microcoleaceae bacterium UBA10368]|jgi:Predicted ATP-binding protein involved in virulence|nr:ATP-binding protein [Microcoleaceae cyanobacterium UBA10368]HCV32772.1 ATP-binding protein [Microcoleaceae cyanobacterium UBA9251]
MRIDRLEIKNFKKFSDYTLNLHPQFTLLVGDNGTGKTTILDALAIAAGVWLVNSPDTTLNNSRRNILPSEIRLEAIATDTVTQFIERKPTQITAIGTINDRPVTWLRQIKTNGSRTSNTEAKQALKIISTLFQQVESGAKIWLPVMAYYGAGRSWLPSNQRDPKALTNTLPSRRWDAFYDCFEERIRITDLHTWFQKEAIASVNRQGQMRSGYNVVKFAILRCIPDAEDLWFDGDRGEIVVAIDGEPQPFSNLSAGQKMMVALIADLAIKIVTQNASFLTEELDTDNKKLPQILQQTSGLVMIDEIDVHLHPKWQRRVIKDLKSTFPLIQFICTTHSPIIISEVEAECIRVLKPHAVTITPPSALGLDANQVLDELMGVSERNRETADSLHQLFKLIDLEDFQAAYREIEMNPDIKRLGELAPEITRAKTLIKFLEGEK